MPKNRNQAYFTKPNYFELGLIVALGGIAPIVELLLPVTGTRFNLYYNIVATCIATSYIAYRIYRHSGIFRFWGFRVDNFWQCIRVYLLYAAVLGTGIYVLGFIAGNTPIPFSFWYLLLLYPVWGILQQFALQNLLIKNLTNLFPNIYIRSTVAALMFGAAHIPLYSLGLLCVAGGLFFSLLYDKYRNMWAVGIAHGILGSLAFYLVVGVNQWEVLTSAFMGW